MKILIIYSDHGVPSTISSQKKKKYVKAQEDFQDLTLGIFSLSLGFLLLEKPQPCPLRSSTG